MPALAQQPPSRAIISLPAVKPSSGVENVLAQRRSVREFSSRKLSDEQLARLLWAAQGITSKDGKRTAPSAGALYPLVLYVAKSDGTFRYDPYRSTLERIESKDLRPSLCNAALSQEFVKDAPIVFVFTAILERTTGRYGERARRYIYLETGHAAQNLLLQATAMGFGGVPVGAFEDLKVADVLRLQPGEEPIYIVPMGYSR